MEDNYYIYDDKNHTIIRTSSEGEEDEEPEIVLNNFQGYSKEAIKSVGEGSHHLALNCSKYLERKIVLFNTENNKITFPIFDPNSDTEPFHGSISRFEIIDQKVLIVLTDSGLVDKITFDYNDEKSPTAVANGLVEPYVDDEGEEDFSIALAITDEVDYTAVASYIRTDANYLCQVVIFNSDFEIEACENFLEKKIFQIHNFAVFGRKDDEIVFIGLTNSGEVEVVLFGFNTVSKEFRILVKVKCTNGVKELSTLIPRGEKNLEVVSRMGKRVSFSFE